MNDRPFRDAAWHYAEYRYRPTEAFLEQLATHLGWSTSDRILDLGVALLRVFEWLPRVREVAGHFDGFSDWNVRLRRQDGAHQQHAH